MNDTADQPIRIGLFGIGLDTYWGQYDGLLARLEGYQATIHEKLQRPGEDYRFPHRPTSVGPIIPAMRGAWYATGV